MSFEKTHSSALQRQNEASLHRSCLDKNRYADKNAALTFLNGWRKVRGRHGRPKHLRPYHCEHCNGWHVTKGKAVKFKKIKA